MTGRVGSGPGAGAGPGPRGWWTGSCWPRQASRPERRTQAGAGGRTYSACCGSFVNDPQRASEAGRKGGHEADRLGDQSQVDSPLPVVVMSPELGAQDPKDLRRPLGEANRPW
ncbi:general stress protein [Streptomyces sp. NRRL S-337]|uniref:general stress protein n=1 Tax=Streptomyces sp. NRRL S-337 TaxID=1463900 RepID=UPI00099CE030